MTDPESDKPTSRRGFFRQAFAGVLGPLTDLIQHRLEAAGAALTGEQHAPGPLRPPGAACDEDFRRLCTSCGACAAACPVHAIRVAPRPRIEPDTQPCVLCEGLPCAAACTTGALAVSPREEVCMGLALWNPAACLLAKGESCHLCADACPVPGALRIEADHLEVADDRCVGCGCCQGACPTEPKAMTVVPF